MKTERPRSSIFAVVTLASAFGLIMMVVHAQFGSAKPGQAAANSPGASAPKTAGEAFKNVKVLKDIPADELIPSMEFITSALNVRCDFCHVEHHFDEDTKKPKRTARKMMQMMFAINTNNFRGHRVVTCYTCHHGSRHPVAIPIIGGENAASEEAALMLPAGGVNAGATAQPALPTADQLIAKDIQALGGEEAIRKITSRVEKGTLSGFGGHTFSVEVDSEAPFKRVSVVQMPHGEMVTAYSGETGWMSGMGRPARPMSSVELPVARLDADFYFPLDLKQQFPRMRTVRTEKVGDQQAYLVLGFKPGRTPTQFYFDQQSGLLIRLVQYEETPLGANPAQTDFSDYREEGGVKIPYQRTISRPGNSFTITISEVQQNVPIAASKFVMPPPPAPGAQMPRP
jgi:photosynthetic reaction center cytochrome c subunit